MDATYRNGIVGALLLAVIVAGVFVFRTSPDAVTAPNVYSNEALGFSIQYPAGFTVDDAERGVVFTVPENTISGTNLSSDTYISVEVRPGAINSCSAEIYLDQPTYKGFVDVGDIRYSVATSMGAAAGNRYEETVYATPVTDGCIAVRYFIHYGVIQNYPEGAVSEFDKPALIAEFDAIRNSLTISRN